MGKVTDIHGGEADRVEANSAAVLDQTRLGG